MKKTLVFAVFAAVAFLFSCSRIESPVSESFKLNITVAGIGSNTNIAQAATKAMKNAWANYDKINIWYDGNDRTTQNPDLVIVYNGSAWVIDGTPTVMPAASGHLLALYEGGNDISKWSFNSSSRYRAPADGSNGKAMPMVAHSENREYTFSDNTLTATLDSWVFDTTVQIVVSGLDAAKASQYSLASTGLYGAAGIESHASNGTMCMTSASYNNAVAGVANADGVAFYFNGAESGAFDYVFTLTDYTSGGAVEKTFTKNATISTSSSSCKGIKFPASYFDPLVPELSIAGISPLATDVYGINPESPDAITKTIIVRSTTDWVIKKGANSDWLSISETSGAANTDCSVTLNAAANATGAKRQATFTVEAKYVNPDTTLVKYFSVTQNVAGTVIAYWVFNENEAETAYPYLYETIDANGNTGVVVNDKGEKTYDKVDNVIKAKGGNTEAWVRFRDHTYLRPSSGTPVGAPVIKYIGDFNKISIEVPGTTLAAGDVVRLDFYVCASDKSPKYWVVDGRNNTTFGYWPALQVVPVASQYKYNLELAGGAQHVVVDQEITESATNTLFFRLHTSVSAAGGSGLYKYCVDGSTVSGPSEAPLYLLGSSDAEGHYPYNMTITKL